MSIASWLNKAWLLSCLPEVRAFRRATAQVASTQARLLRGILRTNCDTLIGRRHGFDCIRDPRYYQQRVPLSRYEDLQDDIARIAAGQGNVLTCERVELLQPTSGTTSGEKLIPYTATLRRQFQRAVAAWMADLLWNRPAIRRGRAYWSISPALSRLRYTPGGVRVGFDDDVSYLGTVERIALRRLLVVPPNLHTLHDLDAFRYATLLALLAADDLALISVWNPTFLTTLFTNFEQWRDRLAPDLPPDRAALLGQPAARLWPGLALISCWGDASAALGLAEIRALFPGVEIQTKGLLATEGVVSFPLVGLPAPILAVRSHFFEFEEVNAGPVRLAHEVEKGGRYRVILTTGGGLYRYQLRDEVEIVDLVNRCPLLRFLGKVDRISDLVGEKLAEVHVRSVLDRVFASRGWTAAFAPLIPVPGRPAFYALYVQGGIADVKSLAAELQAGLEENPHYCYAVGLGQLAPVEVRLLPDHLAAWQVYEAVCLERGQKLGDIKPA